MDTAINSQLFNALLIGGVLSLPLKIMGVWRSAQNGQKGWFAALLILNSMGILELTYLFYFSKPDKKKLKSK
jgi:hypothetical protein